MTGYGAGSHDAGKFIVETEVKSVNARSCDVRCNFPRELLALENDVRDLVKKQLIRGQISVFLKCSTEVDSLIPFDNLQIKKAVSNLKSLAKSAGLSTDGNLDTLLKFISNGNLVHEKLSAGKLRKSVLMAVKQAIRSNLTSREKEGKQLAADIKKRAKKIAYNINKINKLAPRVVKAYSKRIYNRIELLKKQNGVEFDPVKVITEIGVFSERVDITEEIIRMNAHLIAFNSTLKAGGVVGKRLDFILQEMFRETTTIGNKCANADISSRVVDIKEELEKMREQVQNIV